MSNFGYKQQYLRNRNIEVNAIEIPSTDTDSLSMTMKDIVLGTIGNTATITTASPVATTLGPSLTVTTADGSSTVAPASIDVIPGTASDGNDGADLSLSGSNVTGGGDGGDLVLTGGIATGGGSNGKVKVNSVFEVSATSVSQLTSITTSVTADNGAGIITTQAASAAANATQTFTVNNNKVATTDNVLLTIQSYSGSSIPTVRVDNISTGSFDIIIGNCGSAALDAALVIYFVIM